MSCAFAARLLGARRRAFALSFDPARAHIRPPVADCGAGGGCGRRFASAGGPGPVSEEEGRLRLLAWYRFEKAETMREKIRVAWEIINDPILSPPMSTAEKIWFGFTACIPPTVFYLLSCHLREQTRVANREMFESRLQTHLSQGASPSPTERQLAELRTRIEALTVAMQLHIAPGPLAALMVQSQSRAERNAILSQEPLPAGAPVDAEFDWWDATLKLLWLRRGPSPLSDPWVLRWLLRRAWERTLGAADELAAWATGAGSVEVQREREFGGNGARDKSGAG